MENLKCLHVQQITASRNSTANVQLAKRNVMHKLTPWLLLLSMNAYSAGVFVPSPATVNIGGSEGVVRVEFIGNKERENGYSMMHGKLIFYKGTSTLPFQELVSSYLDREETPRFEFIDLNDDGYQDLLFYNSTVGAGNGHEAADVYLWIPRLHKFMQSKTLSQSGLIEKPKDHKGCITINFKCGISAWSSRTLCFQQRTGLWKPASSQSEGCSSE